MRCKRSGQTLTVYRALAIASISYFIDYIQPFYEKLWFVFFYIHNLSFFLDFLLQPQVQGLCVWNLEKFAVAYFKKSRLSFKRFEMENLFIHRRNESNDSNVKCGIFKVSKILAIIIYDLIFILILVFVDPSPATSTCWKKKTSFYGLDARRSRRSLRKTCHAVV